MLATLEPLALGVAVLLEDGEELLEPEIFTFVFWFVLLATFVLLLLVEGEVVEALGLLFQLEVLAVLLLLDGEELLPLMEPELYEPAAEPLALPEAVPVMPLVELFDVL